MLSQNLEKTLHSALSYASERNHAYATLEHLLLSLIDDQDAMAVLKACGIDMVRLGADLSDFLDTEMGDLAISGNSDPL